ncbi:DUF6531 domain-containing protein, partial [Neisseria sp. P0006.S004]|uniref:RHS repeat domain-containing protein n=1 Tax=unclassified Neisseria TaxID=2623750 RepID=UPI003F80A5F8
MPLVWSRSYYSDQDGTGWLGEGWSVPGCQRIIRDAAGLAYTDPLKHITRFEYAGNGLLLSVTDPNGSSTAYHYDTNQHLTLALYPDGSKETFGYD